MVTNQVIAEYIDSKKLLRPTDIAGILNISRSFTYLLLQSGAIPTVRIGKSCRVRPQDLEAYILANIHGLKKSPPV